MELLIEDMPVFKVLIKYHLIVFRKVVYILTMNESGPSFPCTYHGFFFLIFVDLMNENYDLITVLILLLPTGAEYIFMYRKHSRLL